MSEIDLQEVATEAYIYLYPLVVMDVTRKQILSLNSTKYGPENLFIHNRNMATDKWRSVARSNIDTLFSSAWIDLSSGPAYMTLPASGDRFHMFQMLDMWTDTYAVVGSRTTGPNGIRAKIIGPGWENETRGDADVLIYCPTPTTWIIGRTYAQAGNDVEGARAFLDGAVAVSTSPTMFPDDEVGFVSVDVKTPPVAQVDALTPTEFFEKGWALLRHEGSHGTDGSMLLRLRHLGMLEEDQFAFDAQSDEIRTALQHAPGIARERVREATRARSNIVGCWTYTTSGIGTFGNSYLFRAVVARIGLAANPPEDAIYIGSVSDADKQTLHGSNTYLIHFNKGELPPAHSFWSITAYDAPGFMMPNRLNRFGIRSRDDITFNDDGSLDLYAGPECPPMSPESNWIPTIDGVIALQIRMYTPGQAFLSGEWSPPDIQRISL
jgi:hypothetical protein